MTHRFGSRATLPTAAGPLAYYRLARLPELGLPDPARLPYSLRVLLESALRHAEQGRAAPAEVEALARWPAGIGCHEVAFRPARVLHQDYTGTAAMVDLAAMRTAVARLGLDPARVNPVVPTDFVIDHSVQVDYAGTPDAFARNMAVEFARNRERYVFLRWAQQAFANFRVVPPGTGIVHQVNLEYLAPVVQVCDGVAFPDSLVGTDSHTPMINALGVLGWGVGGIEAEAAMLGQPLPLLLPAVVGVRLVGALPPGVTATDAVLTITERLRRHGVVGKFVEFCGPGVAALSLPDRATIANMAPEYGATVGFFPIDAETLRYLRATGRPAAHVALVEQYARAQQLYRAPAAPEPEYSELVEIDLGAIEPCVAGPRRPHDRLPLRAVRSAFAAALAEHEARRQHPAVGRAGGSGARAPEAAPLRDGAVVLAAITSCANTSNPGAMLSAGLLARRAVERGLRARPWVKTSLAPGSPVVVDYLARAGLLAPLEALGFYLVGFGCTTCAGGSGPLAPAVAEAIRAQDLLVAAVLSGNRNFEGRIHPACRLAFLASPPLVVAYALAGTVDIDLTAEPLGVDAAGRPVYLRELWPAADELQAALAAADDPSLYTARYARVFAGPPAWQELPAPRGPLYTWDPRSTYIQEPPYFAGLSLAEPPPPADIVGARALVVLGDSITTDHISPAGAIAPDSPAGQYLLAQRVPPEAFSVYGARRGNHRVMVLGTFANPRLRNALADGREGGWTRHLPSGELLPVSEAAARYAAEGVPLVVLAGREYGAGSSRDWAAKGVALLGVRAVLAESYERIHRSNLVGMGVLPLEFLPGEGRRALGLTGEETFTITGLAALAPGAHVAVWAQRPGGSARQFTMRARLDSPMEVEYYRHGGVLPYVLRRLVGQPTAGAAGPGASDQLREPSAAQGERA